MIIFEKAGARVYGDILVRRGLITRVYWDTGFKRGFWLCLSLITRVEDGALHTALCIGTLHCVSLSGVTSLSKLMFAAVSDKLVP